MKDTPARVVISSQSSASQGEAAGSGDCREYARRAQEAEEMAEFHIDPTLRRAWRQVADGYQVLAHPRRRTIIHARD